MNGYQPTPRLSVHARERCAEMGVGTKRVKRIARDPDLTRTSRGNRIAVRDDEPDLAVVYSEMTNPMTIVTVLWRTDETYDRETYEAN